MISIKIERHSGVPIHRQLVDALTAVIELTELDAGEKLPSIRELSDQLEINPNTTAKVYRELELKGLIESRPGSGCFVLAQEEKSMSAQEKQTRLSDIMERMLYEARREHISEQELLQFVRQRLET